MAASRKTIKKLQEELDALLEHGEDTLSPEVLRIGQKLDKAIFTFTQSRANKKKKMET